MPSDRRPRKPAKRVTPNQGRRSARVGGPKGGSFARSTGAKRPAASRNRGNKARSGMPKTPLAGGAKGPKVGTSFDAPSGKPFNPQTKVNTSFMQEPPHFGVDSKGVHIPTGNSEMVLTRRQLLIAAGVVAGAAAVGAGASAYQSAQEDASSFDTLTVADSQVLTLDDCSEVKPTKVCTKLGSYNLPYGTLVWCNSDSVAVCLLPTSKAKPLAKVALLNLSNGDTTTVLSKAKNQSKGYEIYDVRCSSSGLIWVEENILQGAWCVYTAPINNFSLGSATKVDEGDSSWEMPSLAAVDKNAFWQLQPVSASGDNDDLAGDAQVKTVAFSSPSNVQTIYTYSGRMATDIAVGQGGVIITPTHEGTSSYRQLTLIDATGKVLDALTLPSSMTPTCVGYGTTGFTFAFADIYSYGDGISQLGTYAPTENPNGNYNSVNWFRFGRTPTQSACWCGDRLMVKSTTAVCGINFNDKSYFTYSLENGAQNYGECLASEGVHKSVVTFQNVDNTEAQQTGATSSTEQATYCMVRIWRVNK